MNKTKGASNGVCIGLPDDNALDMLLWAFHRMTSAELRRAVGHLEW